MKILFYILFFFTPLALFPYSSELFEFNKMVSVYILTTLIVASWLAKMVLKRKIIFRRTILDIPILVFLLSQFVSTILSIDFRTSFLGYYSRFNGGFLSLLSYSLLYWAYVSNMNAKKTKRAIYLLLISAVLVSIYAVLEHFGIDKNLWVQDVQNRVFSTLGQPNWLAAWLTALMPLIWASALSEQLTIDNLQLTFKNKKTWLWLGLSSLFFLTLLYTKSRSGILGFITAFLLFWGYLLFRSRKDWKKIVRPFLLIVSPLLLITFLVGTPWSPSVFDKLTNQPINQLTISAPALETGGTESGEIRKIVWKGAIEIWKHYPIFGTGPETFAYSYYNFRPVEHNLVSEWDFLYNKAHNEYLNYLANTGILGLTAYLTLIGFIFYQLWKLKEFALLAGFVSLLVSNFFGFSTVPTSLELFLFPAMAVTLGISNKRKVTSYQKTDSFQKIAITLIFLITSYLLLIASRYWYADFLYAKAKLLNNQGQFVSARENVNSAISLSSHEAIFWNELSQSDAAIAVALFEQNEKDKADTFSQMAISESQTAVTLSPRSLNLKRSQASVFIQLSEIDSKYLKDAKDVIVLAGNLAPTDAKIFYNLGLTEYRLGETDQAVSTLEKTIEMKANYKEARLALAIILTQKGQREKAKEELNYILEKIDPNDSATKRELEELGK